MPRKKTATVEEQVLTVEVMEERKPKKHIVMIKINKVYR